MSIEIKNTLTQLLNKKDLTFDQAHQTVSWIMSDQANQSQAGALLALLQAKGLRFEEIAGAAKAMREKSFKITAPNDSVDTCSTGGNGISTFNISTCAALLAASAGATVAKHGNRSNTRKSGSAEALQALGINIDIDVKKVEESLDKLGICFCYAIHHHPAMKYAGPIRKQLGIPTIFNILGPLTNPAGAPYQVLGVPNQEMLPLMAKVLKKLGSKKAMVVTAEDGLCELSTLSNTHVAELNEGAITTYKLMPEELGFMRGSLNDIGITSPEDSATIIKEIIGGKQGTARDISVLNAAAALYVSNKADTLKDGIAKINQAIDSNKAKDLLNEFIEFTQS